MRFYQFGRNTLQVLFDRVIVTDNRAEIEGRRPRMFIEQRGQFTTGTGLGSSDGLMARFEDIADNHFDGIIGLGNQIVFCELLELIEILRHLRFSQLTVGREAQTNDAVFG